MTPRFKPFTILFFRFSCITTTWNHQIWGEHATESFILYFHSETTHTNLFLKYFSDIVRGKGGGKINLRLSAKLHFKVTISSMSPSSFVKRPKPAAHESYQLGKVSLVTVGVSKFPQCAVAYWALMFTRFIDTEYSTCWIPFWHKWTFPPSVSVWKAIALRSYTNTHAYCWKYDKWKCWQVVI